MARRGGLGRAMGFRMMTRGMRSKKKELVPKQQIVCPLRRSCFW